MIEQLYKKYYAELKYFGLKFLPGKHAQVEDIIIDCMYNICKMHYDAKGIKNALYIAVRNACLTFNRIKKNNIRYVDVEYRPEEAIEINLENELIEADVLKILLHRFKQISPEGQKVLKMFYWQGKTNRQIATELNKSLSTITSLKQYALDRLYNLMRKDTDEEMREHLNFKKYARTHAK